jgi:membrane-associated phospholipid phosphatase
MTVARVQLGLPQAIRLLFVLVALGLWYGSQILIGNRTFNEAGIGDAIHDWLSPLHAFLRDHPKAANGLLIASSFGIDMVGLFLFLSAIFGSTIRPFIGLVMLFSLRQLCQSLTALPPPDGMMWRDPGVPSLLVTYGVSNDLFFSGHTAIAVYGAIELQRRMGWNWLSMAGWLLALFEAGAVLVLHAHYTMDVFTGAVTAGLVSIFAAKLAPLCDDGLECLGRSVSRQPQLPFKSDIDQTSNISVSMTSRDRTSFFRPRS